MKPIPLINAEHAVRIAGLLEAADIPADRYLERARIPLRVREDPTGFLPGRSVWALVGCADRCEGLGDFWLDVASTSDWRRARWARPMTEAVTLGDAIRIMCSSYVRQIPMNVLGLTVENSIAWFWRRRITDTHDWEGSEPAEQYTFSFMLAVVRAVAGPGWLPECLKIESSRYGWTAATQRLPDVRIQYDEPFLAMAIPVPMLSIPVSITARPPAGEDIEPPATEFVGSLRQVLQPWPPSRRISQELAAERLWTSPRTLRRRLTEAGTTWRTVVQDMIFATAVERLEVGRVSVGELAEELGYSHPEHFTRFFKSRAGVSPRAYRAEVEKGKELARRRSDR